MRRGRRRLGQLGAVSSGCLLFFFIRMVEVIDGRARASGSAAGAAGVRSGRSPRAGFSTGDPEATTSLLSSLGELRRREGERARKGRAKLGPVHAFAGIQMRRFFSVRRAVRPSIGPADRSVLILAGLDRLEGRRDGLLGAKGIRGPAAEVSSGVTLK